MGNPPATLPTPNYSGAVISYLTPGTYVSEVISDTGLSQWGVFTATYNTPTNTQITFDVLDNSDVWITSVVSGDDLDAKGVDATTYPEIKLKATLTSSDPLTTSMLSDWTVSYVMGPSAPSGLTAQYANSQIDLAWNNVAGEDGYKIERKIGAGGTYGQIDTTGMDITVYTDTAISGGTTYYYQVRAYNAGGNSGYSNEASATTGMIVTTTNWTDLLQGKRTNMGQAIAFVKFDMKTLGGTTRWKRFRIDKFVHIQDQNILIPDNKIEVQVWMENNNNNGHFDVRDKLISRGYFTNDTCWLNMKRHQITTQSKTYYIVYKLANDIGGGQKAGVRVADDSYFEFEGADITVLGVE